MPSQQQIERFTLAFHRVAVARLREQPSLRDEALRAIDRWEARGASAAGKIYRDAWRDLLRGDLPTLEKTVCADTERAATLRSVSPLGFVLGEEERKQIRRDAMTA